MADEGYQPFPEVSAWAAVPFDPTTYEQYAALLEQARAEATEEAREHAVKTAMRYAGTDTGAIEGLYTTDRGFTRTVAIEAAGWEVAANERGPNAAAIIKDQIEAYEWVLDLVTESRPVTEHMIRELHQMLCRSQDTYVVHTEVGAQEQPLPKGQYKTLPNNPTSLATGKIHHYAPPDMVAPEMSRLVASLSSDEYLNAHPVVRAAYLHYSLAAVHPFADGNGRVSRALASVPLYRALRVPLIVFRDERDAYLNALEASDSGSHAAFVAFVEDRVIDATALIADTTRLGSDSDRHRSIEALRQAAMRRGDVTPDDLEAAAGRLLRAVATEVDQQVPPLGLPRSVQVSTAISINSSTSRKIPAGYRRMKTRESMTMSILTGPFETPDFVGSVGAFIARQSTVPPLVLASDVANIQDLAVPLRDVVPEIRSVARIRLAAWVGRLLDAALASAAEKAANSEGGLPHNS